MPEATALNTAPLKPEQQTQPAGQVIDLEAYKVAKLNAIAGHVGEATGTKVSVKSVQPVQDHPIPIHVPSGEIVNTSNKTGNPVVEGSYGEFKTPLSPLGDLSEHLAFADRVVRGEHNVIDAADRFTQHKQELELKKMQETNAPKKDTRGPVKKLVDWLHDKEAA